MVICDYDNCVDWCAKRITPTYCISAVVSVVGKRYKPAVLTSFSGRSLRSDVDVLADGVQPQVQNSKNIWPYGILP